MPPVLSVAIWFDDTLKKQRSLWMEERVKNWAARFEVRKTSRSLKRRRGIAEPMTRYRLEKETSVDS